MPRNFWKTCLNGVGGWIDDLRGLLQLKDAVTQPQQDTSCVENNSRKADFSEPPRGEPYLSPSIREPTTQIRNTLLFYLQNTKGFLHAIPRPLKAKKKTNPKQ